MKMAPKGHRYVLVKLLARIGRVTQPIKLARDLRDFSPNLPGRQIVIWGVLHLSLNTGFCCGSSFDDDDLVRNVPSPNGHWC